MAENIDIDSIAGRPSSAYPTLRVNLRKTEKDISIKLDDTLNQLAQTVTAAQGEIEDEVNKVKIDVEQYVRTTQDQFSMENSFMGTLTQCEIFSLFVSSFMLTIKWIVFQSTN